MHAHDSDRIIECSFFIESFHDECHLGCSRRSSLAAKVLSFVTLHHLMKTSRSGFDSFTFGSSHIRCRSKYCIVRNRSLLGIRIDNHSSFSSQLLSIILLNTFFDYWVVEGSIHQFEYGQIHHNLWINLGTHHTVLHEIFIHHDVLKQFFIHHDLLNQFFIHHDLLVTFPKFSNFSHSSKSSD